MQHFTQAYTSYTKYVNKQAVVLRTYKQVATISHIRPTRNITKSSNKQYVGFFCTTFCRSIKSNRKVHEELYKEVLRTVKPTQVGSMAFKTTLRPNDVSKTFYDLGDFIVDVTKLSTKGKTGAYYTYPIFVNNNVQRTHHRRRTYGVLLAHLHQVLSTFAKLHYLVSKIVN